MSEKIIIAIDGYSSCGKSTLARSLARRLSYLYLDTGAMYRAVTYYFLLHDINIRDKMEVTGALSKITIGFQYSELSGVSETYLNGQYVEEAIRGMNVSEHVSEISTIREVREKMVQQQRMVGQKKGIVIDGRDIGTVVFPNAELKVFMTADKAIRAKRRLEELIAKGIMVNGEEVEKNLEERDRIDSTREESPLRQATDAMVLDNSHLTPEEQLDKVYQWALERIRLLSLG